MAGPPTIFSPSPTITTPSAVSTKPSAMAAPIPASARFARPTPAASGIAQSSAPQSEMVRARQYQYAGERHPLRHEQPRLQRPEISEQFLLEEQTRGRESPYRGPCRLGLSR